MRAAGSSIMSGEYLVVGWLLAMESGLICTIRAMRKNGADAIQSRASPPSGAPPPGARATPTAGAPRMPQRTIWKFRLTTRPLGREAKRGQPPFRPAKETSNHPLIRHPESHDEVPQDRPCCHHHPRQICRQEGKKECVQFCVLPSLQRIQNSACFPGRRRPLFPPPKLPITAETDPTSDCATEDIMPPRHGLDAVATGINNRRRETRRSPRRDSGGARRSSRIGIDWGRTLRDRQNRTRTYGG